MGGNERRRPATLNVAEAGFRVLLAFCPRGYRREYGQESLELFRDQSRAALRTQGVSGLTRTVMRAYGRQAFSTVVVWIEDFGGAKRTPDRGRRRRDGIVSGAVRDLRHTVRGWVREPRFSVIALGTIAIGVGANTAIFSVVHGVLLQPLPYPEPDRIVNVWQTRADYLADPNPMIRSVGSTYPPSFPTIGDWIELSQSFDALGAYNTQTAAMDMGDRVEEIRVGHVTAGVFRALAVPPALGRVVTAGDDEIGAPAVAVLSHAFWRDHYGGDSTLLGRSMVLSGASYVVIGVMPDGFYFPSPESRLWTTFSDEHKQRPRDWRFIEALGRLRDGVTLDQAQAEVAAVQAAMEDAVGDEEALGIRLVSRSDQVVGRVKLGLTVALGAVGLVLLVACANVAALIMVRTTERRREMAVRVAVGAGRGAILRQLLNESVFLSVAGGVAGVAIAFWLLPVLVGTLPSDMPRIDEIAPDQRVLLASIGVSLVTGLLVGVLPAFSAARQPPATTLQSATRGMAGERGRQRLQRWLVGSEVAVAFALLVGSGLLVRSYARLTSVERGFDARNVYQFTVAAPSDRYVSPDQLDVLRQGLLDRVRAVPGVTMVALTDVAPFDGTGGSSTTIEYETRDGTDENRFQFSVASVGLFETLGVPVVAGRALSEADRRNTEPVVVVNETAVRNYWPDGSPVGRRLRRRGADEWFTVVGVLADVRRRLDRDPVPTYYRPLAQSGRAYLRVLVKTDRIDAATLPAAIRLAVRDVDPAIPVPAVVSLEQNISRSVAMPRFRMILITALAALAAFLAVVGIYGAMAYSTARRAPELGLRIALGATSTRVMSDVLSRAAVTAFAGIAVGLAVGAAAVRVLDEFLFQTTVYDPTVFAAVALLLGSAAVAAAYLPARRATRVDPAEVLRGD